MTSALRDEIRRLHRHRKYTQAEIARIVGCSTAYVSIALGRGQQDSGAWGRIPEVENRDEEHVANLKAEKGFPVAMKLNGKTVWVWPEASK